MIMLLVSKYIFKKANAENEISVDGLNLYEIKNTLLDDHEGELEKGWWFDCWWAGSKNSYQI